MRGFRYLRSVKKPYDTQGLIYYACRAYSSAPRVLQRKIDRLIPRAGGEYAGALREYLLTDASWVEICDRHYISASTLDRIRRRFYELW